MKNPWVIIGVIAVVLFGGSFWYASLSADKNNEGVEVVQHVKGNPEAPVVLVEYSDLQCPACASAQPVVAQVLEQYGDLLRFEYRHFPLPIHPYAVDAALAAEAAGQQGKFFEFHDLLFTNQQAWSQSSTPRTFFFQYAEELDLDMGMFRRHMSSSVLRDNIQAQFAEGREAGVTGTPSFFLNGQKMQYTTYQEFFDQIEAAVGGAILNPDSNSAEGSSDVIFGF